MSQFSFSFFPSAALLAIAFESISNSTRQRDFSFCVVQLRHSVCVFQSSNVVFCFYFSSRKCHRFIYRETNKKMEK